MNYWWHTLGNRALTSIYETKETEVGKWYLHFKQGTKQGRQQTVCLMLCTAKDHPYLQGRSLSSLRKWSHITLICVPLYPCVDDNHFKEAQWVLHVQNPVISGTPSYLLFRRGEGHREGCVQSKGQQNGSQGKNTIKWDLLYMFSGRIWPWESKEGLQALLFQDTKSVDSMSWSQPTFLPMQINLNRSSVESQGINSWI